MSFKKISSEEVWRGRIVSISIGRFQHSDGEIVTREILDHPGAAVILALDGEQLYLIRQPREVVGEDALLELPAGKLDPGEDPLETAKRELGEEIGKGASNWRFIKSFYASPGISDEMFYLYLATDLHDADAEADEQERIEVETVSLDRLPELADECRDAKTIVGINWLVANHA